MANSQSYLGNVGFRRLGERRAKASGKDEPAQCQRRRVWRAMGGYTGAQKLMRMYLVAGAAYGSQGRAYTVSGRNDAVPRCRNFPAMRRLSR
jgi:hypothetical protein